MLKSYVLRCLVHGLMSICAYLDSNTANNGEYCGQKHTKHGSTTLYNFSNFKNNLVDFKIVL